MSCERAGDSTPKKSLKKYIEKIILFFFTYFSEYLKNKTLIEITWTIVRLRHSNAPTVLAYIPGLTHEPIDVVTWLCDRKGDIYALPDSLLPCFSFPSNRAGKFCASFCGRFREKQPSVSVCIHGWFGLTAPISQKGSLWPTAKSVGGRRQHSHGFWQTPNRRFRRQYCYLAQKKFRKSLITCPPDVNTFSDGTVCFWNDPRPLIW